MKKQVLKFLKYPPRFLYAIGLGPIYGRLVLLLTTTGRKSGLPRVTPLQYEEIEGKIYVGAARGQKADWFRNIQANPEVDVRIKSRHFKGRAEPVTEPTRIADFLEYRLEEHPRMLATIMQIEGLPPNATRQQLEAYATNRAMVIIHPTEVSGNNYDPSPHERA